MDTMDYIRVCSHSVSCFSSRGIHNNKILAWEYFWPRFEKEDGHHRSFRLFSREFCWHSRTKGITVKRCQICRISSSLQNLGWKYFWSHFEKTRWPPWGFPLRHEKCLLYSPAVYGGYFSLAFTTPPPRIERFSALTF